MDVLEGVSGCAVIYAATRRRVEQWQEWLADQGIKGSAYHGGMAHHVRDRSAEEWLSGKTRVMVATNAFGMGIDKPDVRCVIHVDVPGALESYYQEAGRAGRDGVRAYAVLLYQPADEDVQRGLIEESHPDLKTIQKVYDTACSIHQIAIGSLPDQPVTLSATRIAGQAGVSPAAVRASIEGLVRADIWNYVPIKRNIAQLRIRQTPANVKHFGARLKNASLAGFVDVLMRTVHADAFADWWELDLRLLERKAGCSRTQVLENLAFLEQRELLHWIPPGASLKVMFNEPRTARLVLDHDRSEHAKRRALRRLSDMLRYVRSVSCRRHFLLKYFGESSAEQCGTCDICMGRHEAVVVTPDEEPALRFILEQVRKGEPVAAGEQVGSKKKLSGLLRWLVQEEYLIPQDMLEESFELSDKARQFLEEWPGR